MSGNSEDVPPDLIGTAEALALLPGTGASGRMALGSYYRLISGGHLRAWRLGGRYYVSKAEVLALLEPVRVQTASEHHKRPTRAQSAARTKEVLERFGV